MDWLMAHEPLIRIGVFLIVFSILLAWEMLLPRRALSVSKSYRWINNLSLILLNTLLLRLLFPATLVGVALVGQERGWGVMNLVELPVGLVVVFSVVLLDFVIWAQHLIFHKVPVLWRLHRMHHADLDFDITTGLRFHPLEIVVSMLVKVGAIILLGAPPIAVLAFEILLNSSAIFNHGNVRLSLIWDKWLRFVIVTPDMHRVHHSWRRTEMNSNFGFFLSWWDVLFNTYCPQPQNGHFDMTIGMEVFRDRKDLRLDRLLAQPFLSSPPLSASPKQESDSSRSE
jgi:sterol desaturase/sphingolipid hydroxylase (fatty acid hydroxylase superfamily)